MVDSTSVSLFTVPTLKSNFSSGPFKIYRFQFTAHSEKSIDLLATRWIENWEMWLNKVFGGMRFPYLNFIACKLCGAKILIDVVMAGQKFNETPRNSSAGNESPLSTNSFGKFVRKLVTHSTKWFSKFHLRFEIVTLYVYKSNVHIFNELNKNKGTLF